MFTVPLKLRLLSSQTPLLFFEQLPFEFSKPLGVYLQLSRHRLSQPRLNIFHHLLSCFLPKWL